MYSVSSSTYMYIYLYTHVYIQRVESLLFDEDLEIARVERCVQLFIKVDLNKIPHLSHAGVVQLLL